jgi:dihydrofolate synthase / folylpolyglutamate synthase
LKYNNVLDYLYNRLPMYQRTGPAAYKNNLENTIFLDEKYGNPHRKFRSVHVAGTNGKGSVSHMLAAIFQSAGYKTGLYTSPHLKDFRERIKINGEMITENRIVDWTGNFIINNKKWKIEPSFFELTVALAFNYFAEEKVDIAIIEVGLGGRLDSTNIISPELSVITNIGLDHTALLGDTLEKIAFEKAGIIKPEIPVIVGTTQLEIRNVFTEVAEDREALLFFADQEFKIPYSTIDLQGKQVFAVEKYGQNVYPGLKLDLAGIYQRKNLPSVLKSVELLQKAGWNISEKDVYSGLAEAAKLTGLMGRWQIVGHNPKIIFDTGHNADGIEQVVSQINQTAYKNLHIIFGTVNDKDINQVLALLPVNATYYFTKAKIPRALDEKVLLSSAERFGLKGRSYASVAEAFEEARKYATKDDLIFVGGSTFVVAEIL